MEAKSTKSVAGSRFTLARLARGASSKGDIMSSITTRPRTRVANHKIDELFRDLVPFENYNKSIVATLLSDGQYIVTHWGTELVRLDTLRRHPGGAVTWLDIRYYSQTTSTLQGRIARNLLTRGEVENLLDWYRNQGEKELYTRLKRLAWVR